MKNIKENLINLGKTIKEDWKNIISNNKELWKIAKQDTVDLAMIAIVIILSILDFTTNIDLMGALGFFAVYILGFWFRLTVWKYKYIHKEEEENN